MRSGENTPAWYLVDHARRIVSGPFVDRTAAGGGERYRDEATRPADADELRAAYGVWADDGTIELRVTPADRAWEAHLSAQLDRLGDPVTRRESPAAELAVDVATALVEAGFELHDRTGRSRDAALGGVSVARGGDGSAYGPGVAVTWVPHDRVVLDHVRPAEATAAVRATMDAALAGVLGALGFAVVADEVTHATLVTGRSDQDTR